MSYDMLQLLYFVMTLVALGCESLLLCFWDLTWCLFPPYNSKQSSKQERSITIKAEDTREPKTQNTTKIKPYILSTQKKKHPLSISCRKPHHQSSYSNRLQHWSPWITTEEIHHIKICRDTCINHGATPKLSEPVPSNIPHLYYTPNSSPAPSCFQPPQESNLNSLNEGIIEAWQDKTPDGQTCSTNNANNPENH